MSLLIKGMDMPKDYKQRIAILDRQTDDGILRLFVSDFDSEAMKYSRRVYPIVEVPTPHGRLIDEDQAQKNIENFVRGWCQDTKNDFNKYRDFAGVFIGMIKQAPTVIEAEE